MKRFILCALFVWAAGLFASVTVKKLPNDAKNVEYYLLQNQYISAVISSKGGTLYKFSNLKTKEEFVGTEGAFRDQFAPNNTAFANALYNAKIIKSSPETAVIELTAPVLDGVNKFNLVKKRYTLNANTAILHVETELTNQRESMSDGTFEFWCNSFFGIEKVQNDIILPLANGIFREKTGSNIFHKEPIAGWIGVIHKNSGVVLLPEYRKFNLAYSWSCPNRDTVEFRNIPEILPAGETVTFRYALAAFNSLDNLNGAGNSGCGSISTADGKLIFKLEGFCNTEANAVLKADGKKISSIPVKLAVGKVNQYSFDMPQNASSVTIEVNDTKNKNLFDLFYAAKPTAQFSAREKRIAPPKDNDPWQFDPADEYATPHFKWLDNSKKLKTLVLVDTNGVRDVIELKQRMNLETVTPTVFPANWAMSWRTKCAFAPGSGGETGIDKLAPFLRQNYDVIIIGSGRTVTRKNMQNMYVSSWSVYPENIRRTILEKVRNGAGLLLLNPQHPDKEMSEILKTLKKDNSFTESMAFSAAPYFPEADISSTVYGKGRIIAVKFNTDCFIAPLLKSRRANFQLLSQKHRFQEYQFAILCRMINNLAGNEKIISELKLAADGKVEINVAEAGEYNFTLFNRYNEKTNDFSKKLIAGKNILQINALQHGMNYLHVTLQNKDFAFASTEHNSDAYIRAIRTKDYFKKGEKVKVRVRLSNAALKLPLSVKIYDNTGRLLYVSDKPEFEWTPDNAVVKHHTIQAELMKNGKIISTVRKEFYLPEVFDLRKEFSNLLWVGADMFPEYTYPERYKQLKKLGFNFLYGGMFGDASSLLLRYAPLESGMNWYAANGRGMHINYKNLQNILKKYNDTQDKKYLVRVPCPNNPDYPEELPPREEEYTPFNSRYLFQLGDEMSMTYYQFPIDFCFCQYCQKGFRNYLKENGWTLEKVNRIWKTDFKKWEDIQAQTYRETLFSTSSTGFVLHRLYMDKVFADTLEQVRRKIREKYPEAMVGPTGVADSPHPYGGNWNFYNMSKFDCGSFYGNPRIMVSFNRSNRFVMNYYGYDYPQGSETNKFWTGLFVGERNTNNWYCPIFLLPDLRHTEVRKYYTDLLWTFRSGIGDLLYHADKSTSQAAILHSQRSLIANFLKSVKGSYFDKELSFAKVFEDLGIAYRFINHEDLSENLLKEFKILVLPEASALSNKDIEIIRNFVKKGGKIIADYEIATQDEWCNSRTKPALNDLFGIKTTRQVYRKVNKHNLKGITIRNAVTGVKLTTGKALGFAETKRGKTPLAITTANTLYLNFEPVYTNMREKAFRDLINNFIKLEPEAKFESDSAVMHGIYNNGAVKHIGLLAEMKFPNAANADRKTCEKYSVKGTLKLAEKGHIYNSTDGKYLGAGNKFDLTLIPGHGTLLTVLPYKADSLKITAPTAIKAGEKADIDCEIIISGNTKAGNHVFLMQVFRPNGTESLEYRTIRHAKDGKFKFAFPSALNEQGTWTFKFKDAASCITSSCKIKVQ